MKTALLILALLVFPGSLFGDTDKKILIVGGAGHIGSTTAVYLTRQGYNVYILDNLSTGSRRLVTVGEDHFLQADADDRNQVLPFLKKNKFDAVIYLAAKSQVEEGENHEGAYYYSNYLVVERFLSMMNEAHIKTVLFSSTAAVYGDQEAQPIAETQSGVPTSVYGATQLMAEGVVQWYARVYGFKTLVFRLFNVFGSVPEFGVGEIQPEPSHLIPRVILGAQNNKPVSIFGTDYSSPDGTAVRDYIHVLDIARAQEKGLLYLKNLTPNLRLGFFDIFNLGSSNGTSVREVINITKEVLGKRITVREKGRRRGDSSNAVVADFSKAQRLLGWSPTIDFRDGITSAIEWEKCKKDLEF